MTERAAPRFADAGTLDDLGRMLDAFFQTAQATPPLLHGVTIRARATQPMRTGDLVQPGAEGSVWPAGRSTGRKAAGVVVSTADAQTVTWSPMALLATRVTDLTGGGYQRLWLADLGRMQATEPTEGVRQPVGYALGYDAARDYHWCLVQPEAAMDSGSRTLTVAVADIDAPVELAAYAGMTAGSLCVAFQAGAGSDMATVYLWDSARSGGTASPYVVAGDGGVWLAIAGRNQHGARRLDDDLTMTAGKKLWLGSNRYLTETDGVLRILDAAGNQKGQF